MGKDKLKCSNQNQQNSLKYFSNHCCAFYSIFASFQFTLFDQILEAISDKATYLSKPKAIKEGTSMCILRHMSDKELKAYQKMEKQKNSMVKKDENEEPKSSELH